MNGKWTGAMAALALAGGFTTFSAPVRAQFFADWGYQRFQIEDGLAPGEIRASLAEQGYRLVGPLRRNGRVLLADVTDRRGRSLRLIVDPFEGEVLQRFLRAGPGQPRVAAVDPRDADREVAPAARTGRQRPPTLGKPAPKVAVRSLPDKPRTAAPRPAPSAATRTAPAPVASTPETRAEAPERVAPRREPAAVPPAPRPEPPAAPPPAATRQTPDFATGVPNAPLD